MKTRLSITIDEEKVRLIDEVLKKGIFRNKSHLLEFILTKFLEGENEAKNKFLAHSLNGGLSNERA